MRDYRVLIIVVCVLLFMIFGVGRSEFVCNTSVCEVTNKSLLGFTRSTVPVDIDNIEDFEQRIHVSMFSLSRELRHPRYDIYAITKDGYAYPFFGTTRSRSLAEIAVRELRNALRSNSKNIRIRY
ncbi:MAG: hypothetical protein ACI37Q_07485 [Candidatus Gastranaerophilaceae bacterium]